MAEIVALLTKAGHQNRIVKQNQEQVRTHTHTHTCRYTL